jgi:hypothetical protein
LADLDSMGFTSPPVQAGVLPATPGTAAACLAHLLSAPTDLPSKATYAALIAQTVTDTPPRNARRLTVRHGFKIAPWPAGTGPRCLFIANTHRRLAMAYRDTEWRDGGWKHALRLLPGSIAPPQQITFWHREKFRAVIIPLDALNLAAGIIPAPPLATNRGAKGAFTAPPASRDGFPAIPGRRPRRIRAIGAASPIGPSCAQ